MGMRLSQKLGRPMLVPAIGLYEAVSSYAVGATTTAPTPGAGAVYYRRTEQVGSYAEIRFEYRHTGAGSAGVGDYVLPMPAGLNIDYTRVGISNTTYTGLVGSGTIVANGTVFEGSAHVLNSGAYANKILLSLGNETSVFTTWGSSFAGFGNTTLILSVIVRVPIVGWTDYVAIGAGISATSPSLVPRYEEYVDAGVFRAASQVGADVTGSSYALSATRIGKTVHLRITGASGSSSAQNTLFCQNLIPASMRPDTLILAPVVVYSGSSIFRVRVNSTGVVELSQYNASFVATNIPNSTVLYALLVSYNIT